MRLFWLALAAFGIWHLYRRESSPGGRGAAGGKGSPVSRITYEVVEHDGGWAYKMGGAFSESYPSREEAVRAAEQAAAAHQSVGADEHIQYQDRQGRWHEEMERGEDRPEVRVERRPS